MAQRSYVGIENMLVNTESGRMQAAFDSYYSCVEGKPAKSASPTSDRALSASFHKDVRDRLLDLVCRQLGRSTSFYDTWGVLGLIQRLEGIAWLADQPSPVEPNPDCLSLDSLGLADASSLQPFEPAAIDLPLPGLPSRMLLSPPPISLPDFSSLLPASTQPAPPSFAPSPKPTPIRRVEWSSLDKSNLLAGVSEFGRKWIQISKSFEFSPGMTPSKLKSYYTNILSRQQ